MRLCSAFVRPVTFEIITAKRSVNFAVKLFWLALDSLRNSSYNCVTVNATGFFRMLRSRINTPVNSQSQRYVPLKIPLFTRQ